MVPARKPGAFPELEGASDARLRVAEVFVSEIRRQIDSHKTSVL